MPGTWEWEQARGIVRAIHVEQWKIAQRLRWEALGVTLDADTALIETKDGIIERIGMAQ